MNNMNYFAKMPLPVWWLTGCLFLLVACPSIGQVQQKLPLTVADYAKWGALELKDVSHDGKWCTYAVSYESHKDTLFLKQIATGKAFSFPGGYKGTFGKTTFSTIVEGKTLHIVDLNDFGSKKIQNAKSLAYGLSGTRIIYESSQRKLVIADENANVIFSRDSLVRQALSPDGSHLAFWTRQKGHNILEVFDLSRGKVKHLFSDDKENIGVLVWDALSQKLLTTGHSGPKMEHQAFYCDIEKSKQYFLGQDIRGEFKDWKLEIAYMHIAEDGKRVFVIFNEPSRANPESEIVEVWNSKDKRLYPKRKGLQGYDAPSCLFEWIPEKRSFSQISDKQFPYLCITRDGKNVLQWDKFAKEPQADKDARIDIWNRDVATGKTTLVAQNISGNNIPLLASPFDSQILLFDDGDWRWRDLESGRSLSIGKALGRTLSRPEFGVHLEREPIALPYFSKDGKWVIVQDEFDLWAINTANAGTKRLTQGREKNRRYHLANSSVIGTPSKLSGLYAGFVDLEKHIPVAVTDSETGQNGYELVSFKDGTVKPLVFGAKRFTQLRASADKSVMICASEDFTTAPSLVLLNASPASSRTLFESNIHHGRYEWGKVKPMEYSRDNGKKMKGLLYLPPNFDGSKQYPLIVFVYETLSKDRFRFRFPSVHEPTGFNIPDLLAQGYVLLLPDTEADLGEPGPAAVDCVSNAVKAIVEQGYIDKGRVGIFGHSHGGYKVHYIITKTDIFAAAMAGDGVTNMVSDYLSLSDWDTPYYWRYEYHQQRMGKPLYENWEGYMRNSPVYHAAGVKTPLLSWSGKEDYHVHRDQSLQMYFALRRLGKENTMLLYPKQGHSLEQPESQEDLREKISDWFGHYLQNKIKPGWMESRY